MAKQRVQDGGMGLGARAPRQWKGVRSYRSDGLSLQNYGKDRQGQARVYNAVDRAELEELIQD